MTFAKWSFRMAAVWGFLVVPPLYFMYDIIGQQSPPALTHPEIYYGFVGVTLAWQVAFLVISSDPARYRPLMLAAMVEKFGFVIAVAILCAQGRIAPSQLPMAGVDLLLGTLFVVSFLKTSPGGLSSAAGA
jgi:hypothetical protein